MNHKDFQKLTDEVIASMMHCDLRTSRGVEKATERVRRTLKRELKEFIDPEPPKAEGGHE